MKNQTNECPIWYVVIRNAWNLESPVETVFKDTDPLKARKEAFDFAKSMLAEIHTGMKNGVVDYNSPSEGFAALAQVSNPVNSNVSAILKDYEVKVIIRQKNDEDDLDINLVSSTMDRDLLGSFYEEACLYLYYNYATDDDITTVYHGDDEDYDVLKIALSDVASCTNHFTTTINTK
jgi:hypothetical protein